LRSKDDETVVISGSVDKSLRAWKITKDGVRKGVFKSEVIGHHESSVTALEVLPESNIVVSAGADSTIKVWDFSAWTGDEPHQAKLLETVKLKIMPLAIAVHNLDSTNRIIAVAGSNSSIQIFVTQPNGTLGLVAILAGHAGWIRALSFVRETRETSSDLLLASASQDKFIRLWRIHIGDTLPIKKAAEDPSLGVLGRSMSTKVHQFPLNSTKASITFEALLLGHEDWIYTAKWHRRDDTLQLLSASADNSLAIWEADPQSGIWVCVSRLGEISAQKGSTTATGSTGGFWIGLWSPNGDAVVSLGRTGSWRVWRLEGDAMWTQSVGCGGHVRSVSDIAWARDGSYLLSTSADQTTRLHAEWKRDGKRSWHEFARPQIHGYDLNCIDTISSTSFVSGADEKPIRVFQEPSAVASILSQLCDISAPTNLPTAANMPVLGLSNKENEAEAPTESETAPDLPQTFSHPPLEDQLSRHLLFPELHKIYGHGLELSCLSVSPPIASTSEEPQVQILASACRASSIDHAVIRLHCTPSWREYCPPLRAHTLTVTALQWSGDGKYLLSVGRDRIFSIFKHDPAAEIDKVKLLCSIKGHTRMILGCAWAPLQAGRVFATAGRDKCVKIWRLNEQQGEPTAEGEHCSLLSSILATAPVTAVAIAPALEEGKVTIAMGLETGAVILSTFSASQGDAAEAATGTRTEIPEALCPSKAVTKLSWRPLRSPSPKEEQKKRALAVASEDGSLRILLV
jgi:elongator complex protein 2